MSKMGMGVSAIYLTSLPLSYLVDTGREIIPMQYPFLNTMLNSPKPITYRPIYRNPMKP